MACSLGKKCTCTRVEAPYCSHWEPSRGSRHYYCARYRLGMGPCICSRSEQKACSHYLPPGKIGRPSKPKICCNRCGSVKSSPVPISNIRILPPFAGNMVHLCNKCTKELT